MSTLAEFEDVLLACGLELIPHYHGGPVRRGDKYQLWTAPGYRKVRAALVEYPGGRVVCFVGDVELDRPSPQREFTSHVELLAAGPGLWAVA